MSAIERKQSVAGWSHICVGGEEFSIPTECVPPTSALAKMLLAKDIGFDEVVKSEKGSPLVHHDSSMFRFVTMFLRGQRTFIRYLTHAEQMVLYNEALFYGIDDLVAALKAEFYPDLDPARVQIFKAGFDMVRQHIMGQFPKFDDMMDTITHQLKNDEKKSHLHHAAITAAEAEKVECKNSWDYLYNYLLRCREIRPFLRKPSNIPEQEQLPTIAPVIAIIVTIVVIGYGQTPAFVPALAIPIAVAPPAIPIVVAAPGQSKKQD